MPDADPPAEMSRFLPLSRLASTGLDFDVTATAAERARIARRLQIVSLEALEAQYVLYRQPGAAVQAEGILTSKLTQQCVVSLDPFETTIEERFVVRFVPADKLSDDPEDPLDPDAIDEIPYAGDRIDLGEATVEQLALGLDPFPRKPGIKLPPGIGSADTAPAEADEEGATIHPFAALTRSRDPD